MGSSVARDNKCTGRMIMDHHLYFEKGSVRVWPLTIFIHNQKNFDFYHRVHYSFALYFWIHWLNDNEPSFVFWKGLGSSWTSDNICWCVSQLWLYHRVRYSFTLDLSIHGLNYNGPSFAFWKWLGSSLASNNIYLQARQIWLLSSCLFSLCFRFIDLRLEL